MTFRGYRPRASRAPVGAALGLVAVMLVASLSVALSIARSPSTESHSLPSGGDAAGPSYVVLGPPNPTILSNPTGESSTGYGNAVAISGSTLAIGIPDESVYGVGDDGEVEIINETTGARLLLTSYNLTVEGAFGAHIALSGNTLVVGAFGETPHSYFDAGRAYIFNASTGALEFQLVSPDSQTDGAFGSAVAVSGTTAVIGAELESDDGLTNAGNVYVVNTVTGTLSALVDPSPSAFGDFGASVAISGDIAVVGAPGQVYGSGAYGNVYEYNAYTGQLIQKLSSPVPVDDGEFGSAVGVSGTSIVVGAPGENGASGPTGAGDAYLFDTVTGAMTEISSPNPVSFGEFGSAIAVDGTTFIVGAVDETSALGVGQAGEAYTFSTVSGTLMSHLFSSAYPESDGDYGAAVAISGDAMMVGAPGEGGPDGGYAYYYPAPSVTLSSPTPLEEGYFGSSISAFGPYVVVGSEELLGSGQAWEFNKVTETVTPLENPDPVAGQRFGNSSAIDASYILVGGSGASPTVDVFNTTTGAYVGSLADPAPSLGSIFGYSVAISGSTALVGSPAADGDSGAAYLFDVATDALLHTFVSPNSQPGGFFGWSVALNGSTAVIGAENETDLILGTPTGGVGNAYLVNLGSDAMTELNSLHEIANGHFGWSVAIDGTLAIVGAPEETNAGNVQGGNAYLFDASSGAMVRGLYDPTPATGGQFGDAVAIDGITAVVGAIEETATRTGAVHIFDLQTGAPVDMFGRPVGSTAARLGVTVTLTGAYIATGATLAYDGGDSEAGIAFIL
jgi:hypothetical protein